MEFHPRGNFYSCLRLRGGSTHGLLNAALAGPAWLTGGAFGPEASAVAVAVCIIAGLLLLAAAHRKGHVMQPAREVASAAVTGRH